jgi:hypothetical protein
MYHATHRNGLLRPVAIGLVTCTSIPHVKSARQFYVTFCCPTRKFDILFSQWLPSRQRMFIIFDCGCQNRRVYICNKASDVLTTIAYTSWIHCWTNESQRLVDTRLYTTTICHGIQTSKTIASGTRDLRIITHHQFLVVGWLMRGQCARITFHASITNYSLHDKTCSQYKHMLLQHDSSIHSSVS